MSTSVAAVVSELASNGPHRSEVGRKQLTLALGELYIASTTLSAKPLLVWETEKGYPRYYIPTESLHDDIKKALSGSSGSGISVATVETVTGAGSNPQAVIERLTLGTKATTWARFLEGPLKGFVRFERGEIGRFIYSSVPVNSAWRLLRLRCPDDWFEDGAIFAGIKNPFKRIDTAAVSHHIVVKVDGEKVAETNVAVLLNETGLKETYYIPATSILNWGAVEKSDLRTACPYKGEAW
jgi:uncharacterized protein (DUF427 family)